MKATDPEALKTLARLGAGHAVIYLPDTTTPEPLTTAGEFRGRPFYMLGDVAHWIPPELDARVGPLAVAYYERGRLRFYVTPVTEAGEIRTGAVIDAIEDARAALEAGQGMAAAVEALDPLGEISEK